MPVLVIPGNHDDRANLVRAFDDHAYLPRDGGFLQYTVDDWPVRLVALDTVVPGESGGRLCADRLAWLDARLGEAPGGPTLVFMHHPPFATGIVAMDAMGLEDPAALATVLRRHPHVEGITCGHIHRTIVRRLRSAGISGATTQRGVWGFHGDHPPHGDRLFQWGRHVPAVTIVVDTQERIAAAFTVIDELTSERGLVTVEDIPAVARGEPGRERSSFVMNIG